MRLPLILSVALLATPALADVPKVMTDLPVVHSLTAQVMGDLGTPDILLDKGADPHHFQLKPSQARALSQADLVLWIGAVGRSAGTDRAGNHAPPEFRRHASRS